MLEAWGGACSEASAWGKIADKPCATEKVAAEAFKWSTTLAGFARHRPTSSQTIPDAGVASNQECPGFGGSIGLNDARASGRNRDRLSAEPGRDKHQPRKSSCKLRHRTSPS